MGNISEKNTNLPLSDPSIKVGLFLLPTRQVAGAIQSTLIRFHTNLPLSDPSIQIWVVFASYTAGSWGHSIHSNSFSQVLWCIFVVIENASIDSRPRITVLMRFPLFTLERSKTIDLTWGELYAHATNTQGCDILGHHFHFEAFSVVHTNLICMFCFDPLSKVFSNRCDFDV